MRVLRSERGLSRARNVGLRHAEGDIAGFPDDLALQDRALLIAFDVFFKQAVHVAVCDSIAVRATYLRDDIGFIDGEVSYEIVVDHGLGVSSPSSPHSATEVFVVPNPTLGLAVWNRRV